jgi:hypothetical protein
MIARGVVFTTDGNGNQYYIPEDKMYIWEELVESQYGSDGKDIEIPSWAKYVEGEVYIVDIKEKL